MEFRATSNSCEGKYLEIFPFPTLTNSSRLQTRQQNWQTKHQHLPSTIVLVLCCNNQTTLGLLVQTKRNNLSQSHIPAECGCAQSIHDIGGGPAPPSSPPSFLQTFYHSTTWPSRVPKKNPKGFWSETKRFRKWIWWI